LAQQIHREFKKLSGKRKFRACVLTKATSSASTSSKAFGFFFYFIFFEFFLEFFFVINFLKIQSI